jgi:hypothetical protein
VRTVPDARSSVRPLAVAVAALALLASCAAPRVYQNKAMDFASIKNVAILPFQNLTTDVAAAERVRDVLANALLATDAFYVLPTGEVARGLSRAQLASPTMPSGDEVTKLGALLKVDAVITGVLKEYGEVRTQSATANVIAISVQMHETQTGKVVWSTAATRGGIGWTARLLGTSAGEPMNHLTEQAVDDVIVRLFK